MNTLYIYINFDTYQFCVTEPPNAGTITYYDLLSEQLNLINIIRFMNEEKAAGRLTGWYCLRVSHVNS